MFDLFVLIAFALLCVLCIRCRLLCCCASTNHQTANAFEDVAYLISDYFNVCLTLHDDNGSFVYIYIVLPVLIIFRI